MNRDSFSGLGRVSQMAGIENNPNLLLAGNVETGKSRVLYGMVYKLLAETEKKKNLYICDGKNDELYELCKDYLKYCQMLRSRFS